MPGIKSFTETLIELRNGQIVIEMSQAMSDALLAVQEFNKGAEVCLTLKIKPLGTKGVSDAVEVTAEVSTKLPKAEIASTLFFINADGQPSRTQDRQEQLPGLSIATNQG